MPSKASNRCRSDIGNKLHQITEMNYQERVIKKCVCVFCVLRIQAQSYALSGPVQYVVVDMSRIFYVNMILYLNLCRFGYAIDYM